jgi:integrase
MRPMSTTYDWVPKNLPGNWPYTAAADGWRRWYKGQTRFVCGRSVPLSKVEDCWIEKKQTIDRGIKPTTGMSVIELCGLFLARQRRRMETGRPEPLNAHTFNDYDRTLEKFADCVGHDLRCDELTPAHFEKFARLFDGKAASSLARSIAYVQAFFNWGESAGHCDAVNFGPDFKKPAESTIRDERIGKVKSYTAKEIKALWKFADAEEKLWIALGLNGAFDNSDLSSLTWDVIDLKQGIIDFRRRKVGKVRRVIPLLPETLKRLEEHGRSTGRSGEQPVFLTPEGHPLVRVKPSAADSTRLNPIDFVAMRWTRLMQQAGLRPKPKKETHMEGDREVAKLHWHPVAERRGFRGLRTTFANLVPPGYSDERNICMGHAHGTTFLDDYLERLGIERIREAVTAVWTAAFSSEKPRGPVRKRQSAVSGDAPAGRAARKRSRAE